MHCSTERINIINPLSTLFHYINYITISFLFKKRQVFSILLSLVLIEILNSPNVLCDKIENENKYCIYLIKQIYEIECF